MNSNINYKPPRWADKFLEWYCKPHLLEEIQGDVYELFYRTIKKNKTQAKIQFVWNVIRFFRWRNINKTSSLNLSTDMFRNYLIIGFRNFLRHRLNNGINVIGLSLAIGITITVYMIVDHQLNSDTFHPDMDRVYQITNTIQSENRNEEWSDTPILLGPSLKEAESGIELMTRIEFANAFIRFNETVFNEFIWFVDADFTNIFNFPVLSGNPHSLNKKNSIILFKDIAIKYFGSIDAVGQTVSIKFSNQRKEDFIVTAVLERPSNSSLHPDVLLSMHMFESLAFKDQYDWSYQTDATFIKLKDSYPVELLASTMKPYKEEQNNASPTWLVNEYKFHSLRGLAQKGQMILGSVSGGAHPAGLFALGFIAFILLIISCFNYMNVAVATAAIRLKEIGIRKVIGGMKNKIVQQFLTENFLLCCIAIGIGLLLTYTVFLPSFNTLFPIHIPFSFTSTNSALIFFLSLLLFTGFVSGAYPAFYISAFTPLSILQGKEKFGQRSLFSRGLLTFQFILAFIAIVGSFVFIDNAMYLKNKDWGYDHKDIITVPVPDKEKYLALHDRVKQDSRIISIAGSGNHIGYQNTRSSFTLNEKRFETIHYKVGFNYLETLNIRLLNGRSFNESIQSDHLESVIINKEFADLMGWSNPIDQTFELDSIKRHVIGVVENFHYEGFYDPLGPVLFSIIPDDEYHYLSLQTNKGNINAVLSSLENHWRSVAPDDPFTGFKQQEVFEDFYQDNTSNIKLLVFISGVAVILGCLGLFGLVSFNITRRLKEFSVRKVFGANLPQIFRLMSKDYIWILVVSFIIGAPSGFFLMNTLIQHIYPDPQPAGIAPFAIAILLMIVTVSITLSTQLKRITRENPAITLRIE